MTLLELVDAVSTGKDWQTIQGIAFRHQDGVVATPARSAARGSRPIAISGAQLPAVGRAGATDHADRGQPWVRAHLLVLLHPHVLSRGARQDRAHPQAGGRGAGDAGAARGTRDPHLPFPGRRLSAVRSRVASVGDRVRRGTAPARSARQGHLEDQLSRRRGRPRAVRNVCAMPGCTSSTWASNQGATRASRRCTSRSPSNRISARCDLLKSIGLMWEYGFMLLDPSSTFAVGPREPGVSANDSRRRLSAGDVLPHAAVRRHADQGCARSFRTIARRRLQSGLRLPRSAAVGRSTKALRTWSASPDGSMVWRP